MIRLASPSGRMNLALALLISTLSGLLTATAFAPLSWWVAAFVAIFLLTLAVDGQGFWRGFLIGICYGFSFFALLVNWLTMYLGPVPWLALSIVMGSFCALGIALVGFITKFTQAWHPLVTALVFAIVIAGREALSNIMPYGGFGWGRLGVSQGNGPLLQVASWIGITGLSALIVWIASATALIVKRQLFSHTRAPSPKSLYSRYAIVVVLSIAALIVPAFAAVADKSHTTMKVAAVQGNANAGLMSNSVAGTFLNHQLSASTAVMGKDFDVMLWPENASDLDPFVNQSARNAIAALVDETGKPLVFGTLNTRGHKLFNSSVVWGSGGAQQVYDKRRPVPFAEYMPNRAFFHALAPNLVNLITHNYEFGTRTPVANVAGHKIGLMICFESSIDDLVQLNSDGGAQALFVQSNNADFGHSSEAAQQFEITRMQALVASKTVVNISTVASSAVVSPTGKVTHRLTDFKPGSFIATIQLRDGVSPAIVVSKFMPWVLWICTAILLAVALLEAHRETKKGTSGATERKSKRS